MSRNLIEELYRKAKQSPSDINEHVERLRELGKEYVRP